jgi:broad specificity phosphatase PhoE
MHTTVFLVRNGATEWNRDGRIAGRREIGLSADGRAQADSLAERFSDVELTEVLTSPLPRAVETAEKLAQKHGLEVARDPRLIDFNAGQWEGRKHADVLGTDEYKRFIADPMTVQIPGGELLSGVRDRVGSSIEQALQDNELGANIVVVSHAGPLRILIAHYLGMDLANYHRLRISPGSVTILRFDSPRGVPRLLAVNCLGDLRVTIQ